jgi:hypothetical protein
VTIKHVKLWITVTPISESATLIVDCFEGCRDHSVAANACLCVYSCNMSRTWIL